MTKGPTLIASNTVGSGGVASVTFSSIPATYTDLLLKASINSVNSPYLQFNGSSSGYSEKLLYGNGASTSSASASGSYFNWAINGYPTANDFASNDIYIPNYASSNYKSLSSDNVQEGNTSLVSLDLDACLWSNTAAITSISVSGNGANINQYSTFYLYGIKNS